MFFVNITYRDDNTITIVIYNDKTKFESVSNLSKLIYSLMQDSNITEITVVDSMGNFEKIYR